MDGLVMATYQTINTRQTVEFVRAQHEKWGKLDKKKATVMQVRVAVSAATAQYYSACIGEVYILIASFFAELCANIAYIDCDVFGFRFRCSGSCRR